jgi:hypothetical protein
MSKIPETRTRRTGVFVPLDSAQAQFIRALDERGNLTLLSSVVAEYVRIQAQQQLQEAEAALKDHQTGYQRQKVSFDLALSEKRQALAQLEYGVSKLRLEALNTADPDRLGELEEKIAQAETTFGEALQALEAWTKANRVTPGASLRTLERTRNLCRACLGLEAGEAATTSTNPQP